MRKLPIGVQGFEGLRRDGYLYVDKSEYIYKLVTWGKAYFLSRPRRFGKSLLLSAIKAYWEGKKECFSGLRIEALEADNPLAWKAHPVFHFDFNGETYVQQGTLEMALDAHLRRWELRYGLDAHKDSAKRSLGERFRDLLETACIQSGLRCVVLVDEYDKPLLDTINLPELEAHNNAILKGFFSILKSCDEFIRFSFITGVTRFERVSIFSDLNQLHDISMAEPYAAVCGITDKELIDNFMPEIEETAVVRRITVEDCIRRLKEQYDGYRFHPYGDDIYNPFSLLLAFSQKSFDAYWFSTGTPTFLTKMIRITGFDVRKLADHTLYVGESTLSQNMGVRENLVLLLYQAGYLTIVDYDEEVREYTLAFPNKEVQYGFWECLIPEFAPDYDAGHGTDILSLRRCVEQGDLDGIRNIFMALFASIPYTQKAAPFEHYFQTVIYLIFKLLGQFVVCELHTYNGRIDCVVGAKRYIYLFEFKRDDTAEAALAQINDMDYALAFAADPRRIFKIGVGFDSKERMISGWKVEEQDRWI